jgi:hypothetical protein
MVSESLLPHFLPTVIADSSAHGKHGIDMLAFPVHAWPFETSFDDIFVGTLDHARTNRPAVLAKLRILHQCLSLAQVVQMGVDLFSFCKIAEEMSGHLQQRSRTSMFEDMEAPVEDVRRKTHASLLQGFQQFGKMFCGVGKIQNPQRIRPMLVRKGLQPVCSIHDGTHVLCLPDLAPPHFPFCQSGEG